jgi:hypothetical protein
MPVTETGINAVMEYLTEIGLRADSEVKDEIRARLEGFESARAQRANETNSKTFYAYRVDLDDYNAKGVFVGGKTRDVPALCEGTLDTAYQFALAESINSPFNYAVFDGNGQLLHMLSQSDVGLAVYTSVGPVTNPDADIVSDLAKVVTLVSASVYRWNHVAEDIAKAREALRCSKPPALPGESAIIVTVQHSGKILWRQFV